MKIGLSSSVRGKQYRGYLAKNIEYMMEYLFTLPRFRPS